MRALIAGSVFLLGCSGALIGQRDMLKMAVEEFNEGLRWGKTDVAAAHLPVAGRQKFAERYAGLQDELEIMDYEVQRMEYDRQKDTAEVRVDISWSLKRRGVLERSVLLEHWEKARGTWLMSEHKLVKGSPLPIFE